MPDQDPPSLSGNMTIDAVVFNELLKNTIDAATRSAEGATKSAAAVQSLEAQVAELKGKCQEMADAMKRLADAAEHEEKAREERGEWLRALIKPETIYYTVLIIAAVFGASWAQALLPGGTP